MPLSDVHSATTARTSAEIGLGTIAFSGGTSNARRLVAKSSTSAHFSFHANTSNRKRKLTFQTPATMLSANLLRVVSILIALVFAFNASGAASYLHHLEHAPAPSSSEHLTSQGAVVPSDGHDESTCPACQAAHMPVTAFGYVPLMIFLGLFVAFLTMIAPPLVSQRVPTPAGCRGPPLV